jgi:GTP cyclohydrolase II
LRRLGLAGREVPGAIDLSLDDRAGLDALVTQRTPPLAGLADRVLPVSATEVAALDLLQQALVLPAVLVGGRRPVAAFAAADFVQLDWTFVALARSHRAAQMTIISRAPVPLDGAVKTEFVVFRGGEGLRDHVAIIVGTPDLSQPVAVRLHSACLTGDLFGSLKCDCGDQLRGTVQHMASAQGGIVLYLDQEGRGNGLANKIRAYSLQAQGYDTYDADEILGFDHDQRHFDFAALMLRQLGVDRVRLMTNNPDKITALIRSGIDVVASTRIHGRVNAHNQAYLDTKRDRAGHLMDTKP